MSGENEMSQQRRGQGPILRFTKMHGLGNDFMVVDAISQPFRLAPDTIRELADRNFGIGFDQLLVVEPPGLPDVDFRYRISGISCQRHYYFCIERLGRDKGICPRRT